jgi:hypothetical protein
MLTHRVFCFKSHILVTFIVSLLQLGGKLVINALELLHIRLQHAQTVLEDRSFLQQAPHVLPLSPQLLVFFNVKIVSIYVA